MRIVTAAAYSASNEVQYSKGHAPLDPSSTFLLYPHEIHYIYVHHLPCERRYLKLAFFEMNLRHLFHRPRSFRHAQSATAFRSTPARRHPQPALRHCFRALPHMRKHMRRRRMPRYCCWSLTRRTHRLGAHGKGIDLCHAHEKPCHNYSDQDIVEKHDLMYHVYAYVRVCLGREGE